MIGALQLKCNSGAVTVRTGDRWRHPLGTAFEIKALSEQWVICEPHSKVPPRLREMMRADGLIVFSSAAVAAAVLTERDGKARDVRGTIKNGGK